MRGGKAIDITGIRRAAEANSMEKKKRDSSEIVHRDLSCSMGLFCFTGFFFVICLDDIWREFNFRLQYHIESIS